jgi:nucleotide-binding universal stress UspA family protein
MFKHILIPTDGSPQSNKAAKAGIRLAQKLGACVTGFYAVELPWPAQVRGADTARGRRVLTAYGREAAAAGRRHLAAMHHVAKAAAVPFDAIMTESVPADTGIVNTAKKLQCDVVVMGSHGRRGLAGVVIGSVTRRVLLKSKVPVLVYR